MDIFIKIVVDLDIWGRQSFGKTTFLNIYTSINQKVWVRYSTKWDICNFSLQRINNSMLHGPNLTWAGLSGKRYCGQMNSFSRFQMEILAERLLGKRMKQMMICVRSACFIKQALWMVWSCLEANGIGHLHFCMDIIQAPD